MKFKIIKSFFAVAFSVCLIYGGMRKGYLTAVSYASDTVSEIAYTASAPIPEASSAAQADTAFGHKKSRHSKNISGMSPSSPSMQSPSASDPNQNTQIEASPETTSDSSLDEYLRGLTCGGCGRNCSLANPRCHNGSRKANNAAAAYYAANPDN